MSIQKTHELFQGNKNVGKWVGGQRPDILDDDVENKNQMLIRLINDTNVNLNGGPNMMYLHLLSIIKGKQIEELTTPDKRLARQAYLSLLNEKPAIITITPDLLLRMMRQLIFVEEQDLPQQVAGSKRKRKSKSIKKHKSKKHKSKKHKSKKHKSKSIKKRKRVGGR